MTNIDRAAEIMREADRKSASDPDINRYCYPSEYAQALADATPPLLMPDLPVPDSDGLWWTEHEKTRSYVRIGSVHEDNDRVVVSDYEGLRRYSMYLTLDEARDTAYALLAAADYAERNQA